MRKDLGSNGRLGFGQKRMGNGREIAGMTEVGREGGREVEERVGEREGGRVLSVKKNSGKRGRGKRGAEQKSRGGFKS